MVGDDEISAKDLFEMRILHLIDTAGPGGAETVFLNLIRGLGSLGHQCIAVLPREDWLSDRLESEHVDYLIMPSSGSLRFDFLWALRNLIKKRKSDLVHAHLIGSATYAGLATILTGIPVIATFHGPTDFRGASRLAPLRRWILSNCVKRLVAVSEGTANALHEYGIDPSRVRVIENGIDTDYFQPGKVGTLRQELKLEPKIRIVGCVGNIRPAKDYRTLLRAAAIVRSRRSDIVFAVAGQGSEKQFAELLSLRKELGLEEAVIFLGQRKAGPELYGAFDLFVSSSESEGLPLSFLEALACGKMIVATATAGAVELLGSQEFGMLVPVGDHGELAGSIISALDRAAPSRKELGEQGRMQVVREYSLSKMVKEYDSLYSQ